MLTTLTANGSAERNLTAADYTCRVCRVQATQEMDRVCEICKALGKTVDPVIPTGAWYDIQFGKICAKRFIFGLGAR